MIGAMRSACRGYASPSSWAKRVVRRVWRLSVAVAGVMVLGRWVLGCY